MEAEEILKMHPECVVSIGQRSYVGRLIGYFGNLIVEDSMTAFMSKTERIRYHAVVDTAVHNGWLGVPSIITDETFMSHSDRCSGKTPEAVTVDDRFPHVCPVCGNRAYVGFTSIERERDGMCRKTTEGRVS